jgi:hypothetical protein
MTNVQPGLRPIAFLAVRTTALIGLALLLVLVLLPAVLVAAAAPIAASGG